MSVAFANFATYWPRFRVITEEEARRKIIESGSGFSKFVGAISIRMPPQKFDLTLDVKRT